MQLESYYTLLEGWDGEKAAAPDKDAIDAAFALILLFDPRFSIETSLEVDGGVCVECGENPVTTFYIKPGGRHIIMLAKTARHASGVGT